MNVIIQDFVVHRSVIRSEIPPTLFRFISILTILCLLIIIINPLTIPPSVMAQTLALTTTNTSYHIDDIVSTRGHFDYLATGELISGHNRTDYEFSQDCFKVLVKAQEEDNSIVNICNCAISLCSNRL
jgi:hypothetical protein